MAKPERKRKTTVELPEALLKEALEVTGKPINETIALGLRLVAARKAFDRLRARRGKYRSKLDLAALRDDE